MSEDIDYSEPPRRSRSESRKNKKKQRKSRSKSRSRSRGRKKSSRPRRSRSRSRDRSRGKSSRSRRRSLDRINPEEEERRRREEAEREANRDQYTVFVSQIHPRVDERDLFEFFSHVGRVEDIRLIRDQRTYKSKGLAYVEFWDKECVSKAIALTGQELGGYPITVQITPSLEKKEENKPMRLYVGSLHQNVTERDLRPVFEAFGPIDAIDIHRDPATGKSRGFGFVTYKSETDAKAALQNLNGLEIAGHAIKVGIVSDNQKELAGDIGTLGDLEDGTGGFLLTAQSRLQLMQKLQRGNDMLPTPSVAPIAPTREAPTNVIAAAQNLAVPRIQPSTCIVLKNMFDPKEEKDPEFHLDVKEDVEEETKKYGKLKHIFVDKDSQGHVYLRFVDVPAAQACVEALNGRWFASRRISAEFIVEATYLLKFPSAK